VLGALDGQTCCRTAQEIHAEIRAGGRDVGIASVYRALELLSELRLVQRLDFGDGLTRFEPIEASGEHHHHLVCRVCGRVSPFADPGLEALLETVARRQSYAVVDHDVVFRGVCPVCRAPSDHPKESRP
jgi:Fur family ferric uptake transcriptional regulator